MPGSSRAGRVTRTRHLGELSSRSSKTPRIAKWQHLYARHRLLACRVRTWRPCVAGAVVRSLFTCPPQGEARDAFQRALIAFLFCLYVVLLYLMSCLESLSASPWLCPSLYYLPVSRPGPTAS
ncbi:hypothetical protein HDV62DRAFT_110626 [Trichoderma sp. SZMC 28011]